MKKSILALATVLAIVAGCAKENLSGSISSSNRTHSGIKTVTGTLDSDITKTYLTTDGGYKFYWFEEEAISVGSVATFEDFTLSEGADTPKAKFESSLDLPVLEEGQYYFAVSPAMTDLKSSADSVWVEYPSELTYQEESGCAEGGEIMVGKSTDGNFAFRNAVGYIKFQLAVPETEVITKIEVSGKNGCRLAGKAKVVFDGNKIDTVRFLSGAETSIAVKFDTPATITTAEPFVTYIPVPPMAKGVSITVTMQSGKAATLTSSSPVNINEVLELPVATFAPVTVAKVGDTEYYSINQAVEAANDFGSDVTITLLGNCNAGADCEVLSKNVVTLDLAGYTLYSVGDKYFTVGSGTNACVITDSSEGKTGMITNTNTGNAAMKIFGHTILRGATLKGSNGISIANGSFILEDGLVEGSSAGLYVKADTESTVDSVVVIGGKIVSTGSNAVVMNAKHTEKVPNLIFRGGEIQSLKAGIYVYDGFLAIYDGTFGAKSNVIYGNRSSSYSNQIDIYGGFFHRDSTTNSIVYGHLTTDSTRVWGGYFNVGPSISYVANGYEVGTCDTTVNGINYTSTIIKKADVACELKIGSAAAIQKASVNEAFEAAKAQSEPATITLLADCSMLDSIGMFNGHNFTLDLNGYTLTTPGTKVFHVNETGALLTIKSSREGGMMFESSTGSNSLLVRGGGKVVLESGILKGNNSSSGHMYVGSEEKGPGEFVMNGGLIWTPNYNPVSVVNGTFTMNGGTLKTDTEEKYCIRVITSGKAVLHGGEFISASSDYKVYVSTEAEINGTFDTLAVAGAGKIAFTGGTYNGTTRILGSDVTVNGCTFISENSYALLIGDSGNVTISNSNITGASDFGAIRTYGATTIEDGTVVTGSGNNALYVGSDKYTGSMTVNGGKFTGRRTAYVSNGTMSVTGGIFNSDQRAVYVANNGTAEIVGGYFNTPKDSVIFTGANAKGMTKGGWFTQPLADSLINSAFILDNSKSTTVEGVTYNYQVIENAGAPDVVSVNGTGYKNIDAAIVAVKTAIAGSNTTLKILGDCSTLTPIEASGANTFTIDLNGKTLSAPVNSSVKEIKITDSSAEANGTITFKGDATVTVSAGTLSFDKGNIKSQDTTAVLLCGTETKALFNMTGGKIEALNDITYTGGGYSAAVVVKDSSEFNLSGGLIDGNTRAVYVRSTSASQYTPVFNMTDGVIRGQKFAFYVYTRASVSITGGIIISENTAGTFVHNGTSNKQVVVNLSGGYYYNNNKTTFNCFSPSSNSNKFNVTGGYFYKDPTSNSASNFKLPSGYEVVTATETKVVEGKEYTFNNQVKAK